MEIEVKGHSGCQIDVVNEDGGIYVYKSTSDPKYLRRLVLQAKKQEAAGKVEYQHIRVPNVYEVRETDDCTFVKMQYVYSKNFVEFFEQAGFEQIDYLIGALVGFIEYEVGKCHLETVSADVFRSKFNDIRKKVESNPVYENNDQLTSIIDRCQNVFEALEDMEMPIGLCHGDLTFSNILFNGNNYYLIDFLDNFVETPLQDIVKIRQDTAYRWSLLMYKKRYDAVRIRTICDKIDKEIDSYFAQKYQWYALHYRIMQLMNFLRILPYAHEANVIEFLVETIQGILEGLCGSDHVEVIGVDINADKLQNEAPTRGYSLLVPVAADKPEYENDLPYVFGLDKDGVILCIKSIMGLDLKKFENIYFTVLRKHDEQYFIVDGMQLQFKRLGIDNAKVVVLEEPTQDQAETIFKTIQQEHIRNGIFVKDADSYFRTDVPDGNGVAIYPIESLDILAPKNKSYVAIDDMFYLTNIIEKSVVGHYISAGGYVVNDVDLFNRYYSLLRPYGRLYLSNIIYAMLLDKKTFRPMIVGDYKDWGTKKDWNRHE